MYGYMISHYAFQRVRKVNLLVYSVGLKILKHVFCFHIFSTNGYDILSDYEYKMVNTSVYVKNN